MELRHTGIRDYYIYEDGRVLNKANNIIIKPQESKGGHLRVELKVKPGVPKKFFFFFLVYSVFVGDLIVGMVIEHMDGNPKNNHYSNLKQSTQKENIKTALNHGTFGKNNKKAIVVRNKHTGEVKSFDMVKTLIDYTGLSIQNGSLSKLKKHSKFKDNFEILDVNGSQSTIENIT